MAGKPPPELPLVVLAKFRRLSVNIFQSFDVQKSASVVVIRPIVLRALAVVFKIRNNFAVLAKPGTEFIFLGYIDINTA